MANLQTTELHIAGIGHVLFHDVDAPMMNLEGFVFGDESTYGGWTWMGDASAEDLVEFNVDGGEITYKRTWDRLQVREVRDPETVSAVINSVNVSAETFNLGFRGHEYNAATKSYRIGTNGAASKRAIALVMEDGSYVAGLRLPNSSIKGSFPQFDLEEFTKIPLNLAILGSLSDVVPGQGPLLWEWFEPRPSNPAGAAPAPVAP